MTNHNFILQSFLSNSISMKCPGSMSPTKLNLIFLIRRHYKVILYNIIVHNIYNYALPYKETLWLIYYITML